MTVQQLRQRVSIIELAVHYGYVIQPKKGRNRPVLFHPTYQDTIIIKHPHHPLQQLYQRAGDFTDAGTIIDFIRHRLTTVFTRFHRPQQHLLTSITNVLYDYLKTDPGPFDPILAQVAKPAAPAPLTLKQSFTLAHFELRPLKDDNYLTQRHITPQTLSRPEFVGKVVSQIAYFDPHLGRLVDWPTAKAQPLKRFIEFSNVAFPYHNGLTTAVTGLEIRNNKLKVHALGSDRLHSVFISNPPPRVQRFFVLESVIDALAHCQLRQIRGEHLFDSVYFSTGGQLTPQQVQTIGAFVSSLSKTPQWQIHLGFDNDLSGHHFDLQFIQQLGFEAFPMLATPAEVNRIAYILPEQAVYQAKQETLLHQINLLNQSLLMPRSSTPSGPRAEGLSQPIRVRRQAEQLLLDIPKNGPSLQAVAQLLLTVMGLSERVQLAKSRAKDFSEELTSVGRGSEPAAVDWPAAGSHEA